MGKECEGLVEPAGCFRQGLDEVACQWGELDLVEASGVRETTAGLSQVREAVEGCRAPLPAALAGLPLCEEACASVAQARCGCGMGWQEAQSGWWRQVFHEGSACRKREGYSSSQLVPPLADPFLAGQVPRHQAGGSLACRRPGNRQKALALAQ